MFFKKKPTKMTFWVWTSADGKWTKKTDAEKKIVDFLSRISNFNNVEYSNSHQIEKQWINGTITHYFYVKISCPSTMRNSIFSEIDSLSLIYSSIYPFEED